MITFVEERVQSGKGDATIRVDLYRQIEARDIDS